MLVSNSGEVFELTPRGEQVWRFLNPHRSADGMRSVLRMKRYPLDYLAE